MKKKCKHDWQLVWACAKCKERMDYKKATARVGGGEDYVRVNAIGDRLERGVK